MWIAMLIAAPGLSGAQPLLDFHDSYAFPASAVEAVAEDAYRARLQSLARDGHLDVDGGMLERLRSLVSHLTAAAVYEHPGAAAIAWEIHTCRRCGENASALAGGRLLIGEEFISSLALTDDELAYLLAHEMAHVLAEHTREYASIARFFVDQGHSRQYRDIQHELDESLALNFRMSTVYAQQEFDADYIGFILGARSGHDPEAMLGMLRKLSADTVSTFTMHPNNSERMRRAQAMRQAAYRIREMGISSR